MVNTQKNGLRPRKKSTEQLMAAIKQPARPQNHFVKKMILTINYKGLIEKHELYFEEEPLSLKEMYNVGFVGDLELKEANGGIRIADVDAGPVGQFKGDEVGRHVFRIIEPKSKSVIEGAHVIKFNFEKKS